MFALELMVARWDEVDRPLLLMGSLPTQMRIHIEC